MRTAAPDAHSPSEGAIRPARTRRFDRQMTVDASGAGGGKDTFYVTTPINYPNDVPHIGHAYTTVAADVLARWRHLNGDHTFMLTGVDEHGEKIAQTAERLGRTPQEHVDGMLPRWKELLDLLRVENDDFIRTSEERHTIRVQEFMQRLHDRGTSTSRRTPARTASPARRTTPSRS